MISPRKSSSLPIIMPQGWVHQRVLSARRLRIKPFPTQLKEAQQTIEELTRENRFEKLRNLNLKQKLKEKQSLLSKIKQERSYEHKHLFEKVRQLRSNLKEKEDELTLISHKLKQGNVTFKKIIRTEEKCTKNLVKKLHEARNDYEEYHSLSKKLETVSEKIFPERDQRVDVKQKTSYRNFLRSGVYSSKSTSAFEHELDESGSTSLCNTDEVDRVTDNASPCDQSPNKKSNYQDEGIVYIPKSQCPLTDNASACDQYFDTGSNDEEHELGYFPEYDYIVSSSNSDTVDFDEEDNDNLDELEANLESAKRTSQMQKENFDMNEKASESCKGHATVTDSRGHKNTTDQRRVHS